MATTEARETALAEQDWGGADLYSSFYLNPAVREQLIARKSV
jgi:hypothetical protein